MKLNVGMGAFAGRHSFRHAVQEGVGATAPTPFVRSRQLSVGPDLSSRFLNGRGQSFFSALTPSVSRFLAPLRQAASRAWPFLRQLTGDDVYDTYLEHLHNNHPDTAPISRSEFHRQQQEHRWHGINRCC